MMLSWMEAGYRVAVSAALENDFVSSLWTLLETFLPDALIAAQAFNRRASLFTTDGDFPKLAAMAGLKLV